MTNPLWPTWLDEVWAKSPAEEGKPGESLARHTWLVLQRLAEMMRLRPYLPERIGFPGLWHCLFWACWLHDFGKAAGGFQRSLRGGPRWPHRHEVLSLAFVGWLEGTFGREEAAWVTAAIVFHHKDAREVSLLYPEPLGDGDLTEDPLGQIAAEVEDGVLEGLWRWWQECPASWLEALGLADSDIRLPSLVSLTEALQGFRKKGPARIYRLLREYRRWEREVKYARQGLLPVGTLALRGHMVSSDHTASAHTDSLPQLPLSWPETLLERWGLPLSNLYPHQKACLDLRGSAVLVAPTGSGKTEAALLWACAQAQHGEPPSRLFYTLPYQASMNAMYDRLEAKSFPGLVGLEHSRSALALYRRLAEDDYSRQQAVQMARWVQNLARLHYFPVRVLSPYQMLKGPYRLKGYEALLTDFFNAVFVFDEIHAYEAGRLAAILATVKYLRENFGARFFVMSATLPGLLKERLAGALGPFTIIQAEPAVFAAFQRHRLLVLEGELLQERWLEQILREVRQGKSVLVCCNTVKRAQQAYEELRQRLGKSAVEAILLHGRFNGRDRLQKERGIQEASGSHSSNRRPVVLVATQVVEVSLDIDLDVIYTDPAPLEALIQRFGRINRRRLQKWAPVYVFTEPAGGQYVYEEDLVRESLAVLKKNADLMIQEEMISAWLDEIYQGEIAARWQKDYSEAYEEFEAACLKTLRAFDTDDGLEEMFYQAFDSIEVLPACLEAQYRSLMEAHEPLEAAQLPVPLAWGQFCRLRQKGMVREERLRGWPWVVDLDYDSDKGLQVG